MEEVLNPIVEVLKMSRGPPADAERISTVHMLIASFTSVMDDMLDGTVSFFITHDFPLLTGFQPDVNFAKIALLKWV